MSDLSIAHRHDWKQVRAIDRCHYVEIVRLCRDCGGESRIPERRDFEHPLTPAFLDRNCDICVREAEKAGVAPDIWRADGHG